MSITSDVLIVGTVRSLNLNRIYRGFFFPKENNLIYKCHNCGKGASLKNFLKHLDPKLCNDYIFEKYRKEDTYVQKKYEQPKYFGHSGEALKKLEKVSSLQVRPPCQTVDSRKKDTLSISLLVVLCSEVLPVG